MMHFDEECFAVCSASGRRLDAHDLCSLPPALEAQARARLELAKLVPTAGGRMGGRNRQRG